MRRTVKMFAFLQSHATITRRRGLSVRIDSNTFCCHLPSADPPDPLATKVFSTANELSPRFRSPSEEAITGTRSSCEHKYPRERLQKSELKRPNCWNFKLSFLLIFKIFSLFSLLRSLIIDRLAVCLACVHLVVPRY